MATSTDKALNYIVSCVCHKLHQLTIVFELCVQQKTNHFALHIIAAEQYCCVQPTMYTTLVRSEIPKDETGTISKQTKWCVSRTKREAYSSPVTTAGSGEERATGKIWRIRLFCCCSFVRLVPSSVRSSSFCSTMNRNRIWLDVNHWSLLVAAFLSVSLDSSIRTTFFSKPSLTWLDDEKSVCVLLCFILSPADTHTDRVCQHIISLTKCCRFPSDADREWKNGKKYKIMKVTRWNQCQRLHHHTHTHETHSR